MNAKNSNDNFNWDEEFSLLNLEETVLLIGHNFYPSIHKDLNERLSKDLHKKLTAFYDRDGLFLFEDSSSKTRAQSVSAQFYKNLTPNQDILNKIIELPFPLIISANPDHFLLDSFKNANFKHQFDYYFSNNASKKHEIKLEEPTAENPILFNLFGSIEQPASLILDYDDLFKLFKNLFSDSNLPDKVKVFLSRIKTYIFIGFHFERWYTQMFIRYINMHEDHYGNQNQNYVLKTILPDNKYSLFFKEQFKLRFIAADLQFLDHLHTYYLNRKELRKPLQIEQSSEAKRINDWIGENEFDKAIRMLDMVLEDDSDKSILLQIKGKYTKYKMDESLGDVAKREDLNIELGQIRRSLQLLTKIL